MMEVEKSEEKIAEKLNCSECRMQFQSKESLDQHIAEHERLRHEFKNRKARLPPQTEIQYEFYLPRLYLPSKLSVPVHEIIRFQCLKDVPKSNLSIFDATNELMQTNIKNQKRNCTGINR